MIRVHDTWCSIFVVFWWVWMIAVYFFRWCESVLKIYKKTGHNLNVKRVLGLKDTLNVLKY